MFVLVALLFGANQLPKLARSLGSASQEFKRGTEEGIAAEAAAKEAAVQEAAGKEALEATATDNGHDRTKESVKD